MKPNFETLKGSPRSFFRKDIRKMLTYLKKKKENQLGI